MDSLVKLQVKQALATGMMQGTITYGGATFPANHSPIDSDRMLVSAGMSTGAEVQIIVDRSVLPAGFSFRQNTPLHLAAADGFTYDMKIAATGLKTGNAWFVQFTCDNIAQRA